MLHLLYALLATVRSSLKPPCEPALAKSPCSAALGDRRSPAEAGLSSGGDPSDAELEPDCVLPHRLGGAPDDGGVKCGSASTALPLQGQRCQEKVPRLIPLGAYGVGVQTTSAYVTVLAITG
jgi:hypothetical protein